MSYRTVKWMILRLLGFVYTFVFISAYYQNDGLIGSSGLSPISNVIQNLRSRFSLLNPVQGFLRYPTLFWFISPSDSNLSWMTNLGLLLSLLVTLGLNSWIVMLALWLIDFSIVTVASMSGSFYNYGWESQLLETGFLAIFLCDLPHLYRKETATLFKDKTILKSSWTIRALWRDGQLTEPSKIILYLMQWLIFRISIGAGLIKIRGSSCWTEKTCLWYHFETQPLPSPLSFVFHFLPKWMLSHAVDMDLYVQVYLVWLVLIPPVNYQPFKWMRRLGGWIQIGFMIMILLSGNFSILNHLTIVPALATLDDYVLSLQKDKSRKDPTPYDKPSHTYARTSLDLLLLCTIGYLSIPVASNLMQWKGQSQQMNASYDPFRLVNTYGAFGSVGTARYEPIISISYDDMGNGTWFEIEFPCKPGNVTRRPCFCAPYQYRLDWNIWFVGFPPHKTYLYQREQWLFILIQKMLEPVNDTSDINPKQKQRPWLHLLDSSATQYFPPQTHIIPKAVKVDMYHYKMAGPLWKIIKDIGFRRAGGKIVWWKRRFKEELIPPVRWDSARKQLVLI